MELKLGSDMVVKVVDGGFNRTFMELKLLASHQWSCGIIVLIVPLWN